MNGVFDLGVKNTVDAVTQLVSNTDAGPAGPMLRVDNNSSAAGATGVQILTEAGKPPMKVNSQARVANLNAALAGRADSAASANFASDAANADKLDGKDIGELPGIVVQTAAILGNTSAAPFGKLTFATPTVDVTTTSSTQRLVGVVSAPLKIDDPNNTGQELQFTYGLCYRVAGNTDAPLVLFYGGNYETRGTATTTPGSWTAAQTKAPGLAATWEVGFCARHDVLIWGPGRDILNGGPGDDTFYAQDDEPDEITCGPGTDRVVNADPSLDSQSFDCIDLVSPGP